MQLRYPSYRVEEKLEVCLQGQRKPIQCEFIRWQPKEDRPNGYFLVIRWNEEIRYINDWFIGSINSKPFQSNIA